MGITSYTSRDVTTLSRRKCPCGGGSVSRTRRRGIDRLMSRVRPVRRYHCMSLGCGWVGNLPRDRAPSSDYLEPLTTPSTFR
jgi:hypothetical protein